MQSTQPMDTAKPYSFNVLRKASARWLGWPSVHKGWYPTLWKDFRIVGPMFLITVLGIVLMQSLFVLDQSIMGSDNAVYHWSGQSSSPAALLFMSAPFIVLLGCAALLIGADRESNSWSWCSSLPIDWRLSLFSKLAVTVILSLIAALLTFILPATFQQLPDFLVTQGSLESLAAAINTLLVWAQLLVLSFLCLLLFNESLKALFVAIGVLIAFQSLSIGLLTDYLVSLCQAVMGSVGNLSHRESLANIVLNCLMLMIQAPLLWWLFRWRWYSGQQTDWMTSLLTRRQGNIRRENILPEEMCPEVSSGLHPSLLSTEMWLAIHNQLRIISVLAVVAILVSKLLFSRLVDPSIGSVAKTEWLAVIAIATAIFGAMTFAGDQGRSRYRFLADRGASVWHLLLARLSVSAAAVAVTVFLVSQLFLLPAGPILSQVPSAVFQLFLGLAMGAPFGFNPEGPDLFFSKWLGSISGLAILAYLWQIGVLASICFRRPMSALFATGLAIASITGISLFVLYLQTNGQGANIPILGNLFLGPGLLLTQSLVHKTSPAACIFLSFAGVLLALQSIALWRFAKGLLVWESPGLGFRFLTAVPGSYLVAFLATSFVAATFGFLVLPAYDEKKVGLLSVEELIRLAQFEQLDLSEVEALGDSLVPAEELVARLNLEATEDGQQDLGNVLVHLWSRLRYEPMTRQLEDFPNLKPSLDEVELWKRATDELSALESSLSKPLRPANRPDQLFLAPSNRAAIRAALIGKLAGLAGEPELSLRAWTAAHHLMRHNLMRHKQLDSFHTLLPQSDLWELMSTLTEDEVRLLGGPEVVRSILPPRIESWKQQMNAAMLYNTSIQIQWLETPDKIPDELADRFYLRQQAPFLIRHYPPLRWLAQRSCVQWLNVDVYPEDLFDREIKAERSLLERLDQMESQPSASIKHEP